MECSRIINRENVGQCKKALIAELPQDEITKTMASTCDIDNAKWHTMIHWNPFFFLSVSVLGGEEEEAGTEVIM